MSPERATDSSLQSVALSGLCFYSYLFPGLRFASLSFTRGYLSSAISDGSLIDTLLHVPNDGYLSSAISDGSLVVAFFVCLLKDSIAPYFITGFFTARIIVRITDILARRSANCRCTGRAWAEIFTKSES